MNKISCPCGSIISSSLSYKVHCNSKKHKQYMNAMNIGYVKIEQGVFFAFNNETIGDKNVSQKRQEV